MHLSSAADTQAVEGAGQIALRQLVLRHTAFLPQLLLRLLAGAEGAVHVDILRTLGGVHQQQYAAVLDLEQTGRHGGAAMLALRRLEPQLTGALTGKSSG